MGWGLNFAKIPGKSGRWGTDRVLLCGKILDTMRAAWIAMMSLPILREAMNVLGVGAMPFRR